MEFLNPITFHYEAVSLYYIIYYLNVLLDKYNVNIDQLYIAIAMWLDLRKPTSMHNSKYFKIPILII